jgi:two-component system OmpR family response regulator
MLRASLSGFLSSNRASILNGKRSETEDATVVVVEGQPELAGSIRKQLEAEGHAVTLAESSAEVLTKCRSGRVSILVIDQAPPGNDGLLLVEMLRAEGCTTPALMIGTPDDVEERIRVLKAGADDCLPEPADIRELAARVEALIRRCGSSTRLKVGDLEMDLVERKVRCMGRSVDLLPQEFKLLEYFLRRPGKVVTRVELLKGVWGSKFTDRTNTVDVQIGKLRRKLDPTGEQRFIATVRAAGFKLILAQ